MKTKEITVTTPHGLHLRVAAKIVEASKKSRSEITFHKDGKKANASSILELLILGVVQNATIEVTAKGDDEQKAIKAVSEVLIDGAGI